MTDDHEMYADDLKSSPEAPSRATYFPGTASMVASQSKMAVTDEWMRGWNACLDAIDRLGGFRND